MSKMSTYLIEHPEILDENESGLNDDPGYIIWAETQDNLDIEYQDEILDPPF